MHVTYHDNLRNDKDLLEQATQTLEDVVATSADLVSAEWKQEDDRGRKVITLQLSDFTGSATARFAREELETPSKLRVRLYRLWGDLLQDRSHRQLDELMGSDAARGSA